MKRFRILEYECGVFSKKCVFRILEYKMGYFVS
jgi:hypothetical protein